MVVILPLLLYPILGFGLLQFALGFGKSQSVVGVVGADNLPIADAPPAPPTPAQAASSLAAAPVNPGNGIDLVVGAAARPHFDEVIRGKSYEPLFTDEDGNRRFLPEYVDSPEDADGLVVRLLDTPNAPPEALLREIDRTPLESRQVDLILAVPPDFRARLDRGERPTLHVLSRQGDDRSRLVNGRVHGALMRWKQRLKKVCLLRRGLPADFDNVSAIDDPERARPASARDLP
jgi:hypothetical protein